MIEKKYETEFYRLWPWKIISWNLRTTSQFWSWHLCYCFSEFFYFNHILPGIDYKNFDYIIWENSNTIFSCPLWITWWFSVILESLILVIKWFLWLVTWANISTSLGISTWINHCSAWSSQRSTIIINFSLLIFIDHFLFSSIDIYQFRMNIIFNGSKI